MNDRMNQQKIENIRIHTKDVISSSNMESNWMMHKTKIDWIKQGVEITHFSMLT